MKREYCLVLAMVLTPLLSGCDKNPAAPTSLSATPAAPSVTTPTAPAPTPTGMTLSGNASLTSVGETSQLTATARFSDGTTKDVSSEPSIKWASSDPAVFTVSSSGLVTVVALGSTSITANYQNRFAFLTATATPAGTFVIAGGVREPGMSGVPGVRVIDTASGRVTQTNQNGSFSVAQLPASQAHLRFEKDGFEPVEYDAKPNDEVAFQHIIRLNAGDTVTPLRLAPHDLSYSIGTGRCYPCRLVRVIAPAAGILHVKVTWTTSETTLNLWAGGQFFFGESREMAADVPVKAPGEVVLYVGRLPPAVDTQLYVPFTISTTLQP